MREAVDIRGFIDRSFIGANRPQSMIITKDKKNIWL